MNDLPVSDLAHILVVDDQIQNLQLLINVLAPRYQVHPFADGAACLRYLEAGRAADLLLLDVIMPAPDGYAVCQRVRAMPGREEVPIIFLTALDSPEDEAKGLALGAVDYIAKPFSPAIVLARVENQVRLSQARRLIQHQNDMLEQSVAERTRELTAQRLELRELNRRFELATKAGTIGVWDWLIADNRLVWDEWMFRLHGVDPARFTGAYEDWRDALHPEDRDRCEGELRQALAGEKDLNIEYRVIWPDGSPHYLVGTANVERDDSGRPVRMTGVNYDITARKLAELEWRHGREMLRLILDSTAEAIYGIDCEGRCTFCNRACLELLGYEREAELLGSNMHEQIHHSQVEGDSLLIHDCKIFHAFQKGEAFHTLDETLWRRDGTSFPAELWSHPQWLDGQVVGAVITFIDITQRRAGERALIDAMAAAEAANRAKSEFLANMSHEIRTPMTGIIGMAQLALRTNLDDRQHDCVHKIETSAQSLLHILNEILDLSKIEAGVMHLEATTFDLWHLTANVLHLLDIPAEEKGLQLVLDYDPTLGTHYRGDPLRLTQVLTNLLANAVKFTESGEVRLVIRPAHPQGLRFEIRDTGIGMSPEEMAGLFHPFAQADGSITRRYGGTGLGLAISQQLVGLMGGQIEVDSTPGQGSCFRFTIPAEPSVPAASPDRPLGRPPAWGSAAPAGTPAPTGLAGPDIPPGQGVPGWGGELSGKRLLLVEDNPINQAVVLGFLEGSGLRVEVAANGEEGVGRCQASAYDLILMDMQMPVMDGLEATRRIRALDPRVPIVALTANAFAEDIARTRAAGMNTHLSKPIDLGHLQAVLNHFLAPQSGLGDPNPQGLVPTQNPVPPENRVPPQNPVLPGGLIPKQGPAEDSATLHPFGGPVPPQGSAEDGATLHLDPAAGLALMGGKDQLFRRILDQFAASYADLELDLRDPEARRTLHSLKGLSANIGAQPLRERTAALEASLDPTLAPAFRRELAAVVDAIRRYLDAGRGDESPAAGEGLAVAGGVGEGDAAGQGVGAGKGEGPGAGEAVVKVAGESTAGEAVVKGEGAGARDAMGKAASVPRPEVSPARKEELLADLRQQAQAANSRRCREALETLTALHLTPAEQAKMHRAADLLQRRNYRELSELSWDN